MSDNSKNSRAKRNSSMSTAQANANASGVNSSSESNNPKEDREKRVTRWTKKLSLNMSNLSNSINESISLDKTNEQENDEKSIDEEEKSQSPDVKRSSRLRKCSNKYSNFSIESIKPGSKRKIAGPNQEAALNHSENSGGTSVDTLNMNKKVKRTKSEVLHKHNENEDSKQTVTDQYDESSEKSTELDAVESESGERDELKRIKELRRIEKFLLEEKKQLELLEKEQEVATSVVNKPNSPIKIKISLNSQDSKSTTSSLVNRSTPKEVHEEAVPVVVPEKTESIKLNLGELVRNCKTKLGILPPSKPVQPEVHMEQIESTETPVQAPIEQAAAEPVPEVTPPEEIKEAIAVAKQLNRSSDDEIIIIEDVEEAKNVDLKEEEEVAKEPVVTNKENDLIEPALNEEARPDTDLTRIEREADVVLIEKKIVSSPEPVPVVSSKQLTPDTVKQQHLYLQQLQELQQQKRHLQELNQQKQQQQQKLAQHHEQLAAAVTSNGGNPMHVAAKNMESFKKFQEIKELQNKKCIDELRVTYEQLIDEIKYNSELKIKEILFESIREKKKLKAEHDKTIAEIKLKQWCANCGKEAIYFCCWNTSYCDEDCQKVHWTKHLKTCARISENQSAGDSQAYEMDSSNDMENIESDKISAEVTYFNTVSKYQSNSGFGSTASSAQSDYNGQHQHQHQQQQQQQRILKQKRKQTSPSQQLLHQSSHQSSSLLQTPDQLYEAQRKIRSQQTFSGFPTNNPTIYPSNNSSNTNTASIINKVRI